MRAAAVGILELQAVRAATELRGALTDIAAALNTLVEFYPKHIEKEDKVFFPASRAYVTDDEDQAMLAEFGEFDRKQIHAKYKAVVEGLEKPK